MQVFWTPDPIRAGLPARLQLLLEDSEEPGEYLFTFLNPGAHDPFNGGITHRMVRGLDFEPEVLFAEDGTKTLHITREDGETVVIGDVDIPVFPVPAPEVPQTTVALVAPDPPQSEDAILWSFINLITNRLRFDEFHEFVRPRMVGRNGPEWYGTDAYRRLQQAAFDFVGIAADPIRAVEEAERSRAAARELQGAGPGPGRGHGPGGHPNGRRYGSTVQHELTRETVLAGVERSYVSGERADLAEPFLRFAPRGQGQRRSADGDGDQSAAAPAALAGVDGRGGARFPLPNVPFVELIWNYWQEEGMLVQSLNHILARFQNRRVGPGRDALARFDLNPLLPLRNLLWGFAEDERRRLTVRRRAAEYEYQYGLRLQGRAIPPANTVVERRGQFIEAFHGLLNASHAFYKERDDKTVDADAFPLLSSLREVHLVLARGAHNQFADLPVTARAEMLTMQWILAQPEMREFLGGPTMVPYEEPWMDRVDTMKSLQSWSEASVTHFFELATHGEQIVLSVRHGRWNESSKTREDAANWALTWRNEIQRYIHAYRTVTGADLSTSIDGTMPSTLLARRLEQQQ